MMACEHPLILVDYGHPHGTIAGVPVADLQNSRPARTREFMSLENPRCGICGTVLSRRQLGARIRPGGDLYDKRFTWS
jgi:hypothetical protein